MAWIAIDLDGTLAIYPPDNGQSIGSPIAPMVDRVKEFVANGIEVRIFTARGAGNIVSDTCARNVREINKWVDEHIGSPLEITCEKDNQCVAIFDDIAIPVEHNTGRTLTGE